MASKFEKLIEYVVSNDEKKARALFHQIVVDKSRKIYEAMDLDDDTERAFNDVEADETANDGDMAGEVDEFGGDEADDLQSDVFADEEGENDGMLDHEYDDEFSDEEEMNPEIDDRVADLESDIDSLKAEFEALLHNEEDTDEDIIDKNEDEEEDLDIEDTDLEDDEEGIEEIESDVEDEDFDSDEQDEDEEEAEEKVEREDEMEKPVDESVIREYVDRVTKGLSNETEDSFVNKKSTVAGKNPMASGSASAKNLVKGGEEKGRPAPTSKDMVNQQIQNRPGGKAGVKSLKSAPKPVIDKESEGTNTKSNLKKV